MKYSVILLLFLYGMGFFKPMLPLIKDLAEHTFNEVQHLATTHHTHGHHHTHHEIKHAAEEETKRGVTINYSETFADHLINNSEGLKHIKFEACPENNTLYLTAFTEVNLDAVYPPPKI